ncbi:MAG: hypothetical protein KDD22_08375, partial [Bdellovibrionales bacterium]|nr:hypothetical protein [Bdellovibrionales bacterium]
MKTLTTKLSIQGAFTQKALTLLFVSLLIGGFQNCSGNKFLRSANSEDPNKLVDPNNPGDPTKTPTADISINNGALYTNNEIVKLQIQTTNATQMALYNDNCPPGDIQENDLEPLKALRDWTLIATDGKHSVHLIARGAEGKISSCESAQITLDKSAPTIKFVKTPAAQTTSSTAHFQIDAQDAVSGVKAIYCRADNEANFTECNANTVLNNLAEGTRSFAAYAEDMAGNRSDTITFDWEIDQTPPKVYIVEPLPPAVSNGDNVAVHFVGEDPNGTGVDHFECRINHKKSFECTSPVIIKDLPEGRHNFEVVAIDEVGLSSNPETVEFYVDTTPSGKFNILGVRGGNDKKIDSFLTDLVVPELVWSQSSGAEKYIATIYDKNGLQVVCAATTFTGQTTSGFLKAPCALADNTVYTARMSAHRNGKTLLAPDFKFMVDATGPKIVIKSIKTRDDLERAVINFEVTDEG